jgi:BirA family transcriptional regulator, biotin operon repressor / biotin---[acetyl-CoA-carboxylase] ligase
MIQDEVLEYLKKKQACVTAEELCQRLGSSRQTVWKRILQLRGLGYDILSVPHLGYQLVSCPDRLYPDEVSSGLHTKIIGRSLHYYDHIPSTMDAAMQLANNKAAEGTVVIAETQTSGRGRLGRQWSSPKYKGLYFSIIVRPDMAPAEVASITLMAAVSVCEAVSRACQLEARIKWPNDILLENSKLGGILTEMNAGLERVMCVVIGIGLNVNTEKKALVEGAASIREHTGSPVSRIALLQETLRQFESYYMKFRRKESGAVLEAWRQASVTLGRRVNIDMHKRRIEGVAVDIDADGGLLVRRDSGFIEKVMAGDVLHCR